MHINEGYSRTGTVAEAEPVYLVEIWSPLAPEVTDSAWHCSEYELSRCDIPEVLDWAQKYTPDDNRSRYVVYACLHSDNRSSETRLRLIGTDPTREGGNSITLEW